MKNKDIIEELVEKCKFHIISWYLDEGNYQPTEEKATKECEKLILKALADQKKAY